MTKIEVKQLTNDSDWEYVFVRHTDGRLVMAVF